MRDPALPRTNAVRKALRLALLQQVPSALLALWLDGGRWATFCGVAVVAYWAGAVLLLARRDAPPGRMELTLLRWGFLPLLALAILLAWVA